MSCSSADTALHRWIWHQLSFKLRSLPVFFLSFKRFSNYSVWNHCACSYIKVYHNNAEVLAWAWHFEAGCVLNSPIDLSPAALAHHRSMLFKTPTLVKNIRTSMLSHTKCLFSPVSDPSKSGFLEKCDSMISTKIFLQDNLPSGSDLFFRSLWFWNDYILDTRVLFFSVVSFFLWSFLCGPWSTCSPVVLLMAVCWLESTLSTFRTLWQGQQKTVVLLHALT